MVRMRENNGPPFKTYERGFPVGFTAEVNGKPEFFLHNHLRFTVLFHRDSETDLARIVGFEVEPFSVKHTYETPWDAIKPRLDSCSPGRMKYVTHGLEPQAVKEGAEVWVEFALSDDVEQQRRLQKENSLRAMDAERRRTQVHANKLQEVVQKTPRRHSMALDDDQERARRQAMEQSKA